MSKTRITIYSPEDFIDTGQGLVADKAKRKLKINEWSEDDRPREKLMHHGAEALSNAELLAILIGSGNETDNAVDLMKKVLDLCDNKLSTLGRMSIEELTSFRGIGEAKAISILAACELGKRRQYEGALQRDSFENAQDIYEYLMPKMRDNDVEEAYALYLNNAMKLIKAVRLSHGGLTETAVDVRRVMREALLCNATVVVLAHNHPSGNLRPSRDDDRLTDQVKEACKVMRLHFSDHLIVTENGYYSYHEEGKL